MFMRGFSSNTQSGGSNRGATFNPGMGGGSDIALITRTIKSGGVGRIHFQATYWNARSIDGSVLQKGMMVRPVQRVGNTWYVVAEGQSPAQHVA